MGFWLAAAFAANALYSGSRARSQDRQANRARNKSFDLQQDQLDELSSALVGFNELFGDLEKNLNQSFGNSFLRNIESNQLASIREASSEAFDRIKQSYAARGIKTSGLVESAKLAVELNQVNQEAQVKANIGVAKQEQKQKKFQAERDLVRDRIGVTDSILTKKQTARSNQSSILGGKAELHAGRATKLFESQDKDIGAAFTVVGKGLQG